MTRITHSADHVAYRTWNAPQVGGALHVDDGPQGLQPMSGCQGASRHRVYATPDPRHLMIQKKGPPALNQEACQA